MQVANPEIESVISKLHYRVTSLIFLVSCLLVTAVEYIGNGINIACVQDGHPDLWAIPQHVMNTYCFIMGTFTLPRHFRGETGESPDSYLAKLVQLSQRKFNQGSV